MSFGECTVNVGDVVEMESYGDRVTSIQIRLPEVYETIVSTRLGEVAFYEAALHAGLCIPIHPTIRRILHFYNIYPAQLDPNAWCSVVYAVVLWQFYKFALFLTEFKNLFSLFKNPKIDFGWLYFKARLKKTLLGAIPATSRGRRKNSSSSRGMTRSSPQVYLGKLGFKGSRKHGTPQILDSLEQGQTYLIKDLLSSRSFLKSFAFDFRKMASSSGDNAKDKSVGDATHIAGDEGTIRKGMRKSLPHLPDLTLLRLLGGKVRPLIPSLELTMSKKISLKKFAQIAEDSKSVTPAENGIVIDEKCPWNEMLYISPSKKGKHAADAKKKGPMSPLEDKKKGSSVKAPAKSKVTSSRAASRRVTPVLALREGTSANSNAILGLNISMLENLIVLEKLLKGGSHLLTGKREMREEAMTQQALDALVGSEITRLQKPPIELERQVAKLEAREQQVVEEIKKTNEDHNAAVARLKKEVAELKEKSILTKKSAIEEYKSSDDFQKVVEQAAFKYFGEGFDLCKKQIGSLHLDIDIQDMGIDAELAEEGEEDEEEQGEEKEEKSTEKGEPDNSVAP
ncbi:hypothetical protein Acr_27g0002450 [Actinidia rufa]|uniref:Transposase (putative) gypsy type domain-containing protein n=1 Tax=Actinidia rufa TaxID=165716 RepID=A0A7J0H5Y9_9ERIC|nr:hypothetical protein Acr_27g0002450 [Actinidia rufa]